LAIPSGILLLLVSLSFSIAPMTASRVIAEIDRLPPDEKRAVFLHVHTLEGEMNPGSFREGMAEAKRGELTPMENGGQLTGAQWLAEYRPCRPKLPGAVDSFIANRRQDRA
jgi:hypothetical protein